VDLSFSLITWLQFEDLAAISLEGGDDVSKRVRDIATLYEY
jgi:hypothetical protein